MALESCSARWTVEEESREAGDGIGESTTPQRDWESRPRRLAHSPELPSEEGAPSLAPGQDLAALAQTVEDVLRHNLAVWSQNLLRLQPKVLVSRHLLESGLWLFKCLRQRQVRAARERRYAPEALSDHSLLLHDLIACWWIALKHCSVRTAVPNRALLCRATGSDPVTLAARERGALCSFEWRVDAALRSGGFVR